MKTNSLRRLCCAALALALVAIVVTTASASPMVIQPIGAVATSEYPGRVGTHTIDGSGLATPLTVVTGSPIPVVWPTHNNAPDPNMWHSNNVVPVTITYDLGLVYSDLAGFHVWNYNENSGNPTFFTLRGAQDVTVSFSTTGLPFSFTNPINYVFGQANGAAEPGQDFVFPRITAQFIQFDITTRLGGANGESYTGLSEVRFVTTDPPVPEPSTFALLGLGAIGLAIRTRRRRRAA